MSNQHESMKQRLMAKLGYTLVAENEVVPLLSDKRISRICGHGYFRHNPLTEKILPAINIGFRTTKVVTAARTIDGIESKLTVSIGFTFDPRRAHVSMENQLTQAVVKSEDTLNDIVRAVVTQALRRIIGDLSIENLCSGQITGRLERTLHHYLPPRLMMYGIRIPPIDESVTLAALHVPEHVDEAAKFVRVRAMMAQGSALAADEFERWQLRSEQLGQIAAGGNTIYMVDSSGGTIQPNNTIPDPNLDKTMLEARNGRNKALHRTNGSWDILQQVPDIPKPKRKTG